MPVIRIWANRLIAGTQKWDDVPEDRKVLIKQELQNRVNNNIITEETMNNIINK